MNHCLTKRRKVLTAIGAGLLGPMFGSATAQTGHYPDRPIKIIVPWSAGGAGDVIVRLIAPSLQQRPGPAYRG
ncbi:hypothetical protein [Variovorax sp. Root411]|uniref:hypothetical protein n=1 Tax=Variovorax sp. Root411 TaxID=1736530 RepID=UPI000A5ECFF3|nr:hypothetical protein [Variovorax sp. Root411]